MNIEDLFKYGVTPKRGENAGKRYKVLQIYPNRVIVADWDDETAPNLSWALGSFDIWREPKTLFEDEHLLATWGNLKKAVAKAGLGDDTRIKIPAGFWIDCGCQDANAKVVKVNGKEAIYFY